MTRPTVHEYAAALRPRYKTAKKGVKRKILDEFCQTTGMHRKAAVRLLNLTAKPRGSRARCPSGPGASGGTSRLGRSRPIWSSTAARVWKASS